MIQFICTACKKTFNVPDRAGGRATTCPHCGQRLLIPPAGVIRQKDIPRTPAPGSLRSVKTVEGTFKPALPAEPGKRPAKPLTAPGKTESILIPSKQAPTDQEQGWHPALWGLIGGIGVAVAALIIGLVIPRGEKLPVEDTGKEENPARRSIAKVNLQPGSDKASATKSPLSAEDMFARASPGVVTISCKNDSGELIGSGSGFFLKPELVVHFRIESPNRNCGFLVTNYHVIESCCRRGNYPDRRLKSRSIRSRYRG